MYTRVLQGGTGLAVTASYEASAVSGTDLTTYTFSSQALGTAAGNRKIVIAVSGGTSARTVSTLTVAGVSASLLVASLGAEMAAELWIAEVPTGTTGDVVVTFSAANDRAGIGVFALYGAGLTVWDSFTSTANPPTGTIDCPIGGVIIGTVSTQSESGANTFSWSGLTEQYDATTENNSSHTGAFDLFAGGASNTTITITPSGAVLDAACAVASLGPG